MSDQWHVWSWDDRHSMWMEVSEGTKAEMTNALARKQQAAAKHLPDARFTITRPGEVPTEAPDE